MPQETSILVLGAGELGMAVLRSLAKRAARQPGTAITALLRPAGINSHVAALRPLGIEVLPCDLADASAAELSNIFKRFDTVIGCTGFVGGRGTQIKLAHAALGAPVRRYFPWQFGVDYDVIGRGSAQDLFDEQLDVRDLLRGQTETEWVILSTGIFTSFLFEPAFGVVDLASDTVHALGSFENTLTVTTAEDIGALTADIVFAEPRIANRVLYTAGDTVTYAQLADILESVLGRKVHRAVWSVRRLRDELAQDPDSALRKYRVVWAEGKGVSWPMAQTFHFQSGIDLAGVERWMRDNMKSSLV